MAEVDAGVLQFVQARVPNVHVYFIIALFHFTHAKIYYCLNYYLVPLGGTLCCSIFSCGTLGLLGSSIVVDLGNVVLYQLAV